MIPPGPVTREGSEELDRFLNQVVPQNAAELARRVKPAESKCLVRVTDFDVATNTYSGYEEAVGSDGVRYAKPGGRTFSPTYSPIFGVGTGSDSLSTIPASVTVRLATVTAAVGPVWELVTVCACTPGAGGSGSVVTTCCPDTALSTTLNVSLLSGPFCGPIGVTYPVAIVWDGASWVSELVGSAQTRFALICSAGHWSLRVEDTLDGFFAGGGSYSTTCDPFSLAVTNLTWFGAAVCFPYSVFITE